MDDRVPDTGFHKRKQSHSLCLPRGFNMLVLESYITVTRDVIFYWATKHASDTIEGIESARLLDPFIWWIRAQNAIVPATVLQDITGGLQLNIYNLRLARNCEAHLRVLITLSELVQMVNVGCQIAYRFRDDVRRINLLRVHRVLEDLSNDLTRRQEGGKQVVLTKEDWAPLIEAVDNLSGSVNINRGQWWRNM
jgi:hypothetical protein